MQLCKNPICGISDCYIFGKGERYLFSIGTRVSVEDVFIFEHSSIKLRAALQKPDLWYFGLLYFW